MCIVEIILGWLQDRNWRFGVLATIHGETLWPTVLYLLPYDILAVQLQGIYLLTP